MRKYEQEARNSLRDGKQSIPATGETSKTRRSYRLHEAQVYALLDISDTLEHLLIELQDRSARE